MTGTLKCSVFLSCNLEGGVRVCGDSVLCYFWCGFAVIFIPTRGIAVQNTKRFAVIATFT